MFNNKLFKKVFLCVVFFTSIATVLADVVVISGLKGTYSWLPEEKKQYSPLHGVIIVENGDLEKIYNDAHNALSSVAHLMFQQIPGEPLSITKTKGNASFAFDDKLLQAFIMHCETEKPFSELRNDGKTLSAFGLEWKKKYREKGGNEAKFNGFSNILIKAIDSYLEKDNSSQARRALKNLFLAFVYLKSETPVDLKKFLVQFFSEEEQQEQAYKENMNFDNVFTAKDKDELIYLINADIVSLDVLNQHKEGIVNLLVVVSSGLYSFLKMPQRNAFFQNKLFTNCVESVVQTLVNVILYDFKTQNLSVSLLPKTIVPLQGLKQFIEQYSKPQQVVITKKGNESYAQATAVDWEALVSHISGVDYYENNSELRAKKENLIIVLSHLFGIDPAPETLNEIGEKLSTDTRKVIFSDMDGTYGNFTLEIRERDNIFKVDVELSEKHASCSLGSEKGTYLKENGYENIMTLSKASEMPILSILNFKELAKNNNEFFLLAESANPNLEILELFLKHGVDLKFNLEDDEGGVPKTFFDMLLKTTDNIQLVQLLLKYGAVISSTGRDNAVIKGNKEIVLLLLKRSKEDPSENYFNDTLQRALRMALRYNKINLFKAIYAAFNPIDKKNLLFYIGSTIWTCECLDFLIKEGANINDQNGKGETFLINFLKQGFLLKIDRVELLLKFGTDLSLKDNDGNTALDIANSKLRKDRKMQEIVNLLEAHARVK
ncbi:hypothetical protein K9K77_02555 [Candidatus Babeliales bacterium]|nr:hypothetical protein [Candidatus Babeliales bacterium]